jgi:uncharacterized protein
MARLRVVLDTNILVSGLAYPGSIPGKLVAAWKGGALGVVLSSYILDELIRVLPRLRKTGLGCDDLRNLTDSMRLFAEIIQPEPFDIAALRDPADKPIVELLLTSKADYLITEDKDLLVLANRYAILTPAAFWQKHGS